LIRLAGLGGLRVHEVAHSTRTTSTGKRGPLRSRAQVATSRWSPPTRPFSRTRSGCRAATGSRPACLHIGGRTVSQRIRPHMIVSHVPGTPHWLRRYFGTELVKRGADLRVVQELMRHSQLSTTALYIGVADSRKTSRHRHPHASRSGCV